ncbi:hypothetical protein B0H11DRAFT_2110833 [Mycena galericulata]|nr:hypothetical protein B0H11DRAFT_2110833 [Mycena galericulata]
MSSGNAADLVSAEYGQRFTNIWVLIPAVIIWHDYLLTLEYEIRFVWKRPKRLSFYLFLVLRYVALLSNIGMLLMSFADVPERCIAWDLTLTFMQNGLVQFMLGLRIYAMYNFNKMVLLILFAAGLTGSILALWSVTSTLPALPTPAGCDFALSEQRAIQLSAAWGLQLLIDVTILGFTLVRAYRQPLKVPGSIVSHMARDGVVSALAHIANILMCRVSYPPQSCQSFGNEPC